MTQGLTNPVLKPPSPASLLLQQGSPGMGARCCARRAKPSGLGCPLLIL